MSLFDMTPDQATDLMNFGFGMMATGGQPGASLAGAAGAGGLAMNQAALQRAQAQNIGAEAQSRQLQNQLAPYQLQFMKYRMQALKNDMNDNDDGTPSSGGAGMPFSATPGTVKPAEMPTTAKPVNEPSIAPAVFRAAQQVGLPPALLHGVYMTESNGNSDAPNGDGGKAVGGMQLHAGAAQDAGVANRNDPQQNLMGGATYLKQQVDKYGNPQLGVLAYNWGPGNVDNWIASGSNPDQIPQPQQDYLKKVNGNMQAAVPASSQRNIGQGVANSSQSAQSTLPQTSANIQNLQGRIAQMSKKLRVAETIGMPTKDLEINLKSAQEQLAAAMKTQQEVESAGPKAEAGKEGENTAEAKKAVSAIDSRIENVKKTIKEMRGLSKNMPSGQGSDIEVGASRFMTKFGGKGEYDKNWEKFNNLNDILFTQELPGVVPAGSRLDIPIVNALQAASKVDPYASHPARMGVLDNLEKRLDQVSENAHKNYGMQSGNASSAPAQEKAFNVTHIYKPGQGIVPIGAQ